MQKILIIGATGAVGLAFIQTYYDQYHFISLSKNQKKQTALKKKFDKVDIVIGSIADRSWLINAFQEIKPDIVIHAAALKHIAASEEKPSETIKTNIIGSLNVIDASKAANVPITIGISSDKACLSNSVYGHTKNLMERLFLEASSTINKFACCRLGNIAGSQGSVIPLWINAASENKVLSVTSAKMNRFVFMPSDVAHIIQEAIINLEEKQKTFIITQNKKAVNMLDMALSISPKIEIIGKRPGEKLNENLVSTDELPFTYVKRNYVFIQKEKNSSKKNRLKKSLNTINAKKMGVSEIKKMVKKAEHFYEENFN